jgi:hypothetical protein
MQAKKASICFARAAWRLEIVLWSLLGFLKSASTGSVTAGMLREIGNSTLAKEGSLIGPQGWN